MLRLARGVLQSPKWTRSYSEGFEISTYLNRIEAITKSKGPVTHKPRQPRKSAPGPKRQINAEGARTSNSARRSKAPGQASMKTEGTSRPEGAPQSRKTLSARQSRPRPTTSGPKKPVADAQETRAAAPRTSVASSESGEWASIDSFTDARSASPRAPKSGRRVSLRKPGSKAKAAKGTRSGKVAAAGPKNSASSVAREHIQYLTPTEALEVVLRNEGTSSGGFIGPVDVSLQTLQPNLVQSAVTYNSRVRSLLNSLPSDVTHDNEELARLVHSYVSGDFGDLVLKSETSHSLTLQSLASEVSANPSMSPSTKQFFARVGAGQLTPKQIVDRA